MTCQVIRQNARKSIYRKTMMLIDALVEKRLGFMHTMAKITETLNNVSCTNLEQNN